MNKEVIIESYINTGVDKKFNFLDPIYFCSNSIYLKSILLKIQFILMDLDFNLVYILYILWIGYSFSKSRFSNIDNQKNPIQIFNLNF